MSTFVYAALTAKREEATPDSSTNRSPPGMRTYVDAFAALVPAEVLTLHAAILSFTTTTTAGKNGPTVTISDPGTLEWTFYALLVISAGLYAVTRFNQSRWGDWDWARIFIPPLAFVGWTMAQKATAFDAVAPSFSQGPRNAIAIIGAAVLAVAASMLAYKADQKPAGSGNHGQAPAPTGGS